MEKIDRMLETLEKFNNPYYFWLNGMDNISS